MCYCDLVLLFLFGLSVIFNFFNSVVILHVDVTMKRYIIFVYLFVCIISLCCWLFGVLFPLFGVCVVSNFVFVYLFKLYVWLCVCFRLFCLLRVCCY